MCPCNCSLFHVHSVSFPSYGWCVRLAVSVRWHGLSHLLIKPSVRNLAAEHMGGWRSLKGHQSQWLAHGSLWECLISERTRWSFLMLSPRHQVERGACWAFLGADPKGLEVARPLLQPANPIMLVIHICIHTHICMRVHMCDDRCLGGSTY